MRRFARLFLFLLGIVQFLALFMAAEHKAYAYADPGSGLLLLQIVSSTVAGAVFMLRARLRKLFNFGKNKASDTPDAQL